MDLAYEMMREEQRLFDTSSRQLIESVQEKEDAVKYIRGFKDRTMGNLLTYQHLSRYTKANREAAARFSAS